MPHFPRRAGGPLMGLALCLGLALSAQAGKLDAGDERIRTNGAPGAETAEPTTLDFGDDSSEWSHDGECDDPRFHGYGMASTTVEADALRDATDCRAAFNKGSITLLDMPMPSQPANRGSGTTLTSQRAPYPAEPTSPEYLAGKVEVASNCPENAPSYIYSRGRSDWGDPSLADEMTTPGPDARPGYLFAYGTRALFDPDGKLRSDPADAYPYLWYAARSGYGDEIFSVAQWLFSTGEARNNHDAKLIANQMYYFAAEACHPEAALHLAAWQINYMRAPGAAVYINKWISLAKTHGGQGLTAQIEQVEASLRYAETRDERAFTTALGVLAWIASLPASGPGTMEPGQRDACADAPALFAASGADLDVAAALSLGGCSPF